MEYGNYQIYWVFPSLLIRPRGPMIFASNNIFKRLYGVLVSVNRECEAVWIKVYQLKALKCMYADENGPNDW